MKILSILLFLSCYFLYAGESYPERPEYEILSKEKNDVLKVGQTLMVFKVNGIQVNREAQRIVWSANKWIDTTYLDDNLSIRQTLTSGKYNFKFYINSIYREIIIPKMEIESGYTITVVLNFKRANHENITLKKPVIYVYPVEENEVNIKLSTKGDLTFTYPIYSPTGWNFTAKNNGEITFDHHQLNYLFWESVQDPNSITADLSHGFILEQKNVISFLEEKLDDFGLNSKEKADFITFWGPQLIRNEHNFIHFVVNEDANQFAELEITPQPDHIYRIYLLFHSFEGKTIPDLKPQVLPKMNRSGFTVIEWGGSEIPQIDM